MSEGVREWEGRGECEGGVAFAEGRWLLALDPGPQPVCHYPRLLKHSPSRKAKPAHGFSSSQSSGW